MPIALHVQPQGLSPAYLVTLAASWTCGSSCCLHVGLAQWTEHKEPRRCWLSRVLTGRCIVPSRWQRQLRKPGAGGRAPGRGACFRPCSCARPDRGACQVQAQGCVLLPNCCDHTCHTGLWEKMWTLL